MPNIDIEEGYIKGDSEEYFRFLHDHLAYVFVGKGQPESRYIGKTAYDAVVARTPIVVYGKCDTKHIMFSNLEFYFDDERGLEKIYRALLDPETRERWIEEQAKEIFFKLPPSEFKFSDYVSDIHVQELNEGEYFEIRERELESEVEPELVETRVTVKKSQLKIIPVF